MSPPGMELLHTPRITSKSILSPVILFSTSPDAVKLLQQTPSSLIPLLLMMVPPWPNSFVAEILLSVMPMASNQPNNSSTPSLTTSEKGGPWIPLSVMEANMRSPSESLISFALSSSKITSLYLITNIRIRLKTRFGLAKRYTNTVMNTSGCPACCWLLCLQYICVVLNHLASPTLQGICPVQALEGTTPDISFLLHFSFYEPVYYRIDSSEPDLNFPSSSNEKKGYWVGFADNQGDSLTWRILTEDTQKIIIRSGVRSALRTTTNQRLASPSGEGTTLPFPIPYSQQSQNSLPLDPLDASTPNFEHFVKSQTGEDEDNPILMANIDIPNLLGISFLLPPEDNGERHMAKVIDIDDHGQTLEDIKFKLKINKDQAEEIMSYNQLMDYIQKATDAEEDPDSLFKFRDIVAHQGPLESTDPNHKGSKYNVMVEWESGEVTYEPLTLISKDDPITCAVYAKKHDLLDTTGWKHLKRYAKTSKRLIRAVKQSRIRQVRASARYQHGFQVPKDYNDAMRLDKENGNTHWQDAMDLELTQIHEYKVFKDTGKAKFHNGKVVTPDGFQKIRVHFVYAVKHDGRFKARLVADGHLTKEPVESIYSGVVSLRSLRMVVFLSQLNNLEIWGADVGNAYLEA